MSIRSPLSRATTFSLTCREYGKNFSVISSRLALSKGTFSASALLPNTTTKSLSRDSVERQRRVARPTPKDAVPVRRFGPAPQEDQPECVHVMPNDKPRHRIKRDGGRAAVERIARTNQRDCARHDDERARLNGNTRPQSGAGDGQNGRAHTSDLQSLMRTSSAVFCLKKKTHQTPP